MIPEPTNGSTIRACVEYHDQTYLVLCKWGREWVTWEMNREGHCYWGRYSNSKVDALKSFTERIKLEKIVEKGF